MLEFPVEYTEGRAQRQAQVRPGIAVRHREHIDAIEFILFLDDSMEAGLECCSQPVAGEMTVIDGVQDPAIPWAIRIGFHGSRERRRPA